MSANIRARTVGAATVTVFNAGDLLLDMGSALDVPAPEWREGDREAFEQPLQIPMQCVLMQLPGTTVLVDAGIYDFEPYSEHWLSGYAPPDSLPVQMVAAGIEPAAVEHVVITHAHFDHFNGLTQTTEDGSLEPVFPNATVYLGMGDWLSMEMRAALETENSLEARTFGFLDACGLLIVVDGHRSIAQGIEILPTPGETPGHLSVRMESSGQTLYCVGDLYHHEVEVERPDWAVTWADKPAIRASRSVIADAALRENALLVATHIRGFGRLALGRDGVRWTQA